MKKAKGRLVFAVAVQVKKGYTIGLRVRDGGNRAFDRWS
jgi:hypothetical protein